MLRYRNRPPEVCSRRRLASEGERGGRRWTSCAWSPARSRCTPMTST